MSEHIFFLLYGVLGGFGLGLACGVLWITRR
jgi:hypothetical protein